MPSPRIITALIFLLAAGACQADGLPIRKVASSGICHDPSSPNYSQIKAYLSYATMAACVASGGRPRKGSIETPQSQTRQAGGPLYDSDDPTIIKKSRGNICYDSSSGRFTEIVHYAAYRSLDDCVADGGRLP